MKKIFALLLVTILAMTAAASAATYTHEHLTFEYNDSFFEITMEDHGDEEDMVILHDKNQGGIRIHLRDMEDGETFPTAEEIAKDLNVEVTKMDEWGNFKDVLTYDTQTDNFIESVFIAPIYDDDGDIDDILTVNINGEVIEDEDAAMESSDWTSEVVDTLKVIDD